MEIEDSSEFKDFVKTLVYMEEKGLSCSDKKQSLRLTGKDEFSSRTGIGSCERYAFVVPEEPGMDDIFIPPGETNNAINGDIVLARVTKESSGARREGTIIRILERGVTTNMSVHIQKVQTLALLFQMIKNLTGIFLFRNMHPREQWKAIKLL